MEAEDTGMTDKTGTPIALGDVVQLQVKGHSEYKSLFVVAEHHAQIGLFAPGTEKNENSPGVALTPEIAAVVVVVDSVRL